MAYRHLLTRAWIAGVLLIVGTIESPRLATAQTALDTYVAKADPFSTVGLGSTYNVVNTIVDPINMPPLYTAHVIDMTSQRWRDLSEVDRIDWQHYMTVYTPNLTPPGSFSNFGALVIGGGNNGGAPPGADPALGALAALTGSVVTSLRTVPNEPLTFTGDPFGPRREDEIIAKTFRNFLDGGDDEWPLLLPMVKSAVRAMDTVQDFLPTVIGASDVPDEFFVTGGSKRGWTTWLTAAVDSRVTAIAPAVIDVLNMDESMLHHKQFYDGVTTAISGGYSAWVHDYTDLGIFDELSTPTAQPLLDIVDPYEYRDRLTMPKYLVNSTGDEFFVPSSAQFYVDDLLGQTYLRYVPNTGHGLNADADDSIFTFYQAILAGTALPEFSWSLVGDNAIQVDTVDAPIAVNLWQATNPVENDFRNAVVGLPWTSSALVDQGGGVFVGSVPIPATGATGFMIELIYASPFASDFKFTTQIRVLTPEGELPTLSWIDPAGGMFEDDTNWTPDVAPTLPNTTVFDQAATYTVDFAADAVTKRAIFHQGDVTLDLAGNQYDVANTKQTSLVIGRDSGDNPTVTLQSGTLATQTVAIAQDAGSAGQLTVAGGGSLTVAQQLKVNDTLTVSGGSATVGTGAVETNPGTLRLHADGLLSGTGNVVADVINGGTVGPGNSTGLIQVTGDYEQQGGGILNIELAGAADFDVLAISGMATLDGTLDVVLINSFFPTPGETFEIMTFASHSGEFSSATGDVGLLDPVTFLLPLYSSTNLLLFTAIPGDGSLNGEVQAADYTLWANGFGSGTPSFTTGDYNGDGSTNAADYTIWANNFGMMVAAPEASAAAAVPEPSTFVLAIVGIIGLCCYRRRRNR